MKYLEIDTWNGEGYSYSCGVKTIEINDLEQHLETMKPLLLLPDMYRTTRVKDPEDGVVYTLHYTIGDDNGATYLRRMPEYIIGVVLKPMINDYEIVTEKLRWQWYINKVINSYGVPSIEDYEMFNEVHHEIGDEDIILCPISDESRLEYVDGDGVENEVWRDKDTDTYYDVPVEIVRDFNNKVKIES